MPFGSFAGGVARGVQAGTQSRLENRRLDLAARQQQLDEAGQRQKLISAGLTQTREDIDGLISAAREAKEKGAAVEKLPPIRRLIETMGAELGVAAPGLQTPTGGMPVPGSEQLIQNGLNRFDAIVGATPGPEPEEPTPAFGGTGFDAQVSNTAIEIAGKAQRGEVLSADDKRAYSIAYGKMTEPRVVGSPETGFSIVTPRVDPALFPAPDQLGKAVTGDTARASEGQPLGLPDYRRAIASIETPGASDPYSVIHVPTASGDRAYGKYGVMGSNIPAWTREAIGRSLTPEEFLADPAAQDAVFDTKFSQFIQQYGSPEEAASVWFTGRPMAEGATRSDGNLTGEQYVQRFTGNLAGGGVSATPRATGVDVSQIPGRGATPMRRGAWHSSARAGILRSPCATRSSTRMDQSTAASFSR